MEKKNKVVVALALAVVLSLVAFICFQVQPTTAAPAWKRTLDDGRTPIFQEDDTTFPIVISNPGTYVLTSNLTVPAGTNGIEIQASNVFLDLNGFTISGPNPQGSPTTYGIKSIDFCTVINGTVRNMYYGMYTASNSYVEGITAWANTYGIKVEANTIVTGCGAHENDYGIMGSLGCVLIKNAVSDGNADGIIGTINSIVKENTVYNMNNGRGIVAQEGCTVAGNVVGNIPSGFFAITTGDGCTVTENSVTSGGGGISTGVGCTVIGNTVRDWDTGLVLGAGTGYVNNVINVEAPGGTPVTGGIQMGMNICNGVICP